MMPHLYNWLYLLLALALMVPPAPLPVDFRKSLRRAGANYPGGVAGVWQNWLDLIRAAIGVYFLSEKAIEVPADAQPGTEFAALALKAGLLSFVLLVQTIRMHRSVQLLAPVFYLCGLTLILGGLENGHIPKLPISIPIPISGGFAVIVGWLFAIGGKNLAYQLPAMAVAVALAGYVLGPMVPTLLNAALVLLPVVLSLLFKKRLLFAAAAPAQG